MRVFVSSARTLIGFATLVMCLILSFKGFPLAMVSWLGAGVAMTGYTGAFTTIFHNNSDSPSTPVGKFLTVCIGFAIASIGGAVIDWGGLVTINIGKFPINLQYISVLVGILSGVFNIDKTWGGVDAERKS